MVVWCYVLASVLGLVIGFYLLLEVHYFIRIAFSVILARFFKKRIRVMDTAKCTSICITNDIDIYLNHMNNARFLRELDFARVDFYERSGIYKVIVSKNGKIVQGATTIRYRRFIPVFTIFHIASRVIYWDDQSIYFEHRFLNPKDGFVHCVAVCKQRLIGCSAEDVMSTILSRENNKSFDNIKMVSPDNILTSKNCTALSVTDSNENTTNMTVSSSPNQSQNIETSFNHDVSQIENGDYTKYKPELAADLAKWLEFNEISSNLLKKAGNC